MLVNWVAVGREASVACWLKPGGLCLEETGRSEAAGWYSKHLLLPGSGLRTEVLTFFRTEAHSAFWFRRQNSFKVQDSFKLDFRNTKSQTFVPN